jgi:monoterpene epsilon-lactone hydrolase
MGRTATHNRIVPGHRQRESWQLFTFGQSGKLGGMRPGDGAGSIERVRSVRWDTDDRPATLAARLYVLGMKVARDKQAFAGEERTLRTARDKQRRGDRPPTVWTRLRCRVTKSYETGIPVWTASPRRGATRARVMYVHGGGYVHPLTKDYWRLVRALTSSTAEVVVPCYPLAPDATVDDVLPRLLEIYERLASGSTPVVLMGDSAGGALVIVLAQHIRSRGGRAPAGVVALCPWLDATLNESDVADFEATDPVLDETGLRAAGRWWAGALSPTDPDVSPLCGDLRGLPTIDVVIGDRDILRPAVDDLAEQGRRSNAEVHVHEVTAMFHVWMTRPIPEGRRMRRKLTAFVRTRSKTAHHNA